MRSGVDGSAREGIPAAMHRPAVQGYAQVEARRQAARGPVGAAGERRETERVVPRVQHVAEHHVEAVAGNLDVLVAMPARSGELGHRAEEFGDVERDLVLGELAVA